MKCILFCQNTYAFGILEPIKTVLQRKEYKYIWFVADKIKASFPYQDEEHTSVIKDLQAFESDAIFVPGNEVPYYLRGLKIQIFHGLAGEKKGHFRIRNYFDLYLTQGPYFTKKFNKLKQKHKDFDVIETGWPKLDAYAKTNLQFIDTKASLFKTHQVEKILLYAPTFSPKLTSAPFLLDEIKALANNKAYLIVIKFHPLMAQEWIDAYKDLANNISNIIFKDDKNIIPFLLISDVLISDTSSVVYEFLLLDKPVITFANSSKNILWENTTEYKNLEALVKNTINFDPFANSRTYICEQFHPYTDGKSSERMVDAAKLYIKTHGVPQKRRLSFLRRMKIHSIFGTPSKL